MEIHGVKITYFKHVQNVCARFGKTETGNGFFRYIWVDKGTAHRPK